MVESKETGHAGENRYFAITAEFKESIVVYLEFIEERDNDVIYDYMPEHKDADRGRVAVNRKTRKRKLINRSKDDHGFSYYNHAWNRIDEMLDEGTLRQETYAAWY